MGKWTPDYIDDVLHFKIKNLVSGAIKRVALEKTEPTITYEEFVHDLETGDSFTTSLVEALVKELAERRTRPKINDDRRIVTDRSARILHQLAERNPYYRERIIGRHFPRRRSATMTDYLSAPSFDMNTDDGDIFGHMLDNDAIMEGVRINSDLYDAYEGGQNARAVSSPSPPTEAPSPMPQPIIQAHFRNEPWATISSSGSTLTRQPSLRRPARSRTVDFNEFTRRRRSTTRENQNRRVERSDSPDHWEPFRHAQARRFFPFFRTRREPLAPEAFSPHEADDSPDAPEPSSGPWFNLTPPITREPATIEEVSAEPEVSDERAQAAPTPRLRRGGVRAPESILSRHASPFPTILSAHILEDTTLPAVQPAHDGTHASAADATGYPTPSSTEHEFFA